MSESQQTMRLNIMSFLVPTQRDEESGDGLKTVYNEGVHKAQPQILRRPDDSNILDKEKSGLLRMTKKK